MKSRLVSTQETLSQHTTLVSHIADQQKQCEGRLSLVKTSDLEVRRTKRDHHDLQVNMQTSVIDSYNNIVSSAKNITLKSLQFLHAYSSAELSNKLDH